MTRKTTPWWKWEFSLTGIFLVCIFGTLTWMSFEDPGDSSASRATSYGFGIALGVITIILGIWQWQDRRRLSFRIRNHDEDSE